MGMIAILLALFLFVMSDGQPGKTISDRELKHVYRSSMSLKACWQMCEVQIEPACTRVKVENNVCVLLSSEPYPPLQPGCPRNAIKCPLNFGNPSMYGRPTGNGMSVASCYVVHVEGWTWEDAREICQFQESDLVSIETEEEQMHVAQLLAGHLVKGEGIWTSGKRDLKDNVWEWKSSPVSMDYTHWSPGEPGPELNGQDCLQLYLSGPYMWDNTYCFFEKPFVCEVAASTET